MTSSSADPARPARQTVVIGGSMAGLLAARVLADHFERVTLVERDRFPEGPEFAQRRAPGPPHPPAPDARAAHSEATLPRHRRRPASRRWDPPGHPPRFCLAQHGGMGAALPLRRRHYRVQPAPDRMERAAPPGCPAAGARPPGHRSHHPCCPPTTARGLAGVRVHALNERETAAQRDYDLDADLVVDASGRGSERRSGCRRSGTMRRARRSSTPFWGTRAVSTAGRPSTNPTSRASTSKWRRPGSCGPGRPSPSRTTAGS